MTTRPRLCPPNRDTRALHSFPTRRSSDLTGTSADAALVKQYCVTCHNERMKIGGLVLEGLEDRKSTRLNSSHSQSSYAVFCLQKKKRHRAGRRQSPGGSRGRGLGRQPALR